jgi:ABC-type sugar transport system permease subunit
MYKKIAGYQAFRTIIYLPVIITTTIFATLFKGMLEAGGPIQMICGRLGIEPPSTFVNSEDYALKTVLFFVIYSGIGGRFVLFGGAMNSIDPSIIDAGRIDGAGPVRELVSIIVPCIWPTLSTMLLLCTTGIFTASGPSLLFDKGDYGTSTISYWIYEITSGSGGSGESVELAAAIGLIFTILGLPIVLVVKKLTGITEDN